MNVVPHQFNVSREAAPRAVSGRWDAHAVLSVVHRRWLVALAVGAACFSAGAAYALLATPRFTATSMLLIDTKMAPPQPAQISQGNPEIAIDPAVIESQVEILRSNKIAFDVVDRLDLVRDPEFVQLQPGALRRAADGVLSALGLAPAAGPPPDPRQVAAAEFEQKVRVARSGRSLLAEIAVTTLDPTKSARIANAVADAYIQDQLSNRLETGQRTTDWMRARLEEVKARAETADRALDRVRAERAAPGAALPVSEDGVSAGEAELVLAAQVARGTYEALQTRVARVSSFLQQQALPVTEARVINTALPPLGKSSPKTGVVLLLGLVGGLVAGLAAAFLREMLDHRLRWPAQVTQQLGQNYLGAFPFARGCLDYLASGATSGREPSRRRRGESIPLLTGGHDGSLDALEALRSAKVLIDQKTERRHCRVVGVVSAGVGEGKTTVAVNLAILFSQMRERVLLIDADLRSGHLARALAGGRDGAHPDGLAAAVTGRLGLGACVLRTEHGFDFLPGFSGAAPDHPLGILASPEVHRVIDEAKAAYDYVLVDVPAILHTMDARPLLREIDAFVVAVRSGSTKAQDVQSVFANCPAIEDRSVGVILNASRLKRPSGLAPGRMAAA